MRYRRVVFGIGVLALAVSLGCGKGPNTKLTQAARPADDPWQKGLAALRRDTDTDSCRRILLDLNNDLSKVPEAAQPVATAPEVLASLSTDLGLNEAERKEIQSSAFTALDGAYLAEVIYLRDIALSLDVAALPPAKRALVAFNWVTREVILAPANPQQSLPPLPPSAVLRRGSGSGLDRAYVFLELCRQLGLDGYFIGPPGAKSTKSYAPPANDKPHRPFWAVGVRAGNQVLLFDPWAGEPLKFNLEQLRSQAAEFAPQFTAFATANNTTTDELRKAEVFFSFPLSAFTARLNVLEEKLEAERGLKLTVNQDTLLKNAANAAKGVPASFWNPANDPFTLTRSLAYFLCTVEGGFSPAGPAGISALASAYQASLLPGRQLLALPQGFEYKEPADRIAILSIEKFAQSFLKSPTPRELFQRGQYVEATRMLVREWETYTKMAERLRNEPDRKKTVEDWIVRANKVYGNLNGAVKPDELAAAQQALAQFLKSDARGVEVLIEQTVGPAGTGEATYLLALCKHEQAERLSGLDANDPTKLNAEAQKAWDAAYDWWKRYLDILTTNPEAFPGREAQAKQLAARAGRMAKTAP